MTLENAIKSIRGLDTAAMEKTKRRLDSIIKPLDSLGLLEKHLIKIAGITGKSEFDFSKKAVVVFCADNGVVAQGISQSSQEVTAIVSENMATGDTCVCAMAAVAGADIIPVDIGIAGDIHHAGILRRKIARGTRDISVEPAMDRDEAVQALETGIELAYKLAGEGYTLLATGEMGIGNTTTSSAVAAVLLELPAHAVTGRGAGLSSGALDRKIDIIDRAIKQHAPDKGDALDILAKVGGFDIAGMAGLCIGAAGAGVPVIIDGFISAVAAAIACALAPAVGAYILPSHVSAEPAGRLLLDYLGLEPPLNAHMRLGEGTGAVATFPLYDMIANVYKRMVDFSDEDMSPYEKLD